MNNMFQPLLDAGMIVQQWKPRAYYSVGDNVEVYTDGAWYPGVVTELKNKGFDGYAYLVKINDGVNFPYAHARWFWWTACVLRPAVAAEVFAENKGDHTQ